MREFLGGPLVMGQEELWRVVAGGQLPPIGFQHPSEGEQDWSPLGRTFLFTQVSQKYLDTLNVFAGNV